MPSRPEISHPTLHFQSTWIFKDSFIDLVVVATSDETHEGLVIRALEAGKDVLVEKPATLSKESGGRMLDAERNARAKSEKSGSQRSARVFVGYMRRYAHSFTGAFKREVASIPRIRYARVRDIIGSNDLFVQQSGTFPINSRYTDDIPADAVRESKNLLDNLYAETFPGQEVTGEKERFWRFLGGLARMICR
jgi:hypothetical protein